MKDITIILPVSRAEFIDRVLTNIELLETGNHRVSLLVLVDGPNDLFVKVRNHISKLKFTELLCVQFESAHKLRHFDVLGRRLRISDIHNQIKTNLKKCDYVLSLEDDTLIPHNSLELLYNEYMKDPYMGFISGLEIGRWGHPHIGAWEVDNLYNIENITSIDKPESVKEVDAAGFYCMLTPFEVYMSHEFKPFGNNQLGPDVEYGIELRKQGYINKVHNKVLCTHLTKDSEIKFSNTDIVRVQLKKNQDNNNFRISRVF